MTGRPPAVVASPGPSENPHGGSGRLRDAAPWREQRPCARQRGRYLLPQGRVFYRVLRLPTGHQLDTETRLSRSIPETPILRA